MQLLVSVLVVSLVDKTRKFKMSSLDIFITAEHCILGDLWRRALTYTKILLWQLYYKERVHVGVHAGKGRRGDWLAVSADIHVISPHRSAEPSLFSPFSWTKSVLLNGNIVQSLIWEPKRTIRNGSLNHSKINRNQQCRVWDSKPGLLFCASPYEKNRLGPTGLKLNYLKLGPRITST